MTIKIKSIPHKYRNKYLRDGSSSGTIIGGSAGGSSSVSSGGGLPYTLDDDGNYVIGKKITVQGDIFADTNIIANGELSAWGLGSSSSGGTGNTGGGYWGEIEGEIINQTDLVNYINDRVSGATSGLTEVSWNDIKNKPSTYIPSAHGHGIADITNLQTALDNKSDTNHTHTDKLDVASFTAHTANTVSHITATERNNWNNTYSNSHTHSNKSVLDGISSTNISSWNNKLDKTVWDKAFYFDSNDNLKVKLNLIGEKEVSAWGVGESSGSTGLITIVDNLTNTSTDAALSANQGRILKSLIDNFEGGLTSVSWNDIQNKPSTFTPSAHGHAISDITNLQSTLDSKSNTNHTHSNYSLTSHTHTFAALTNRPTTLSGYGIVDAASASHTHTDKLDVTAFTAHTANTTLHITSTERSNWNGAVANSHTHNNKSVLDGISSTQITNWNSAYSNNHTHSNKSVLDGISSTNISNWNNKLDKSVWDKAFYFDSNDNLKVKLNLIGEKEVAAWGVGESSGGTGLVTIVDNLTSTSTDAALSANQGRVLKSLIDNFEGGLTSVSWNDVKNKPSTFTPSAHGHVISDITNLQSTLDSKASTSHTHSNYSLTSHTHSNYSLTSHTHTFSSLTSKPTTLSGYGITDAATANHTHSYAGSSSVGGAANNAVKLATPRTISIAGVATGSASFDGSANVTINTTLNTESVKNTLKNEFKTLNLSSLNADTWYPCSLPVATSKRIKIIFKNALQGNKPTWATHASGFSLYLEWDVNGNGWGTTSEHRNIYGYTYSFATVSPCGGVSQNTMGSTEIIWLRGGAIYYYWTDNNSNFTINSNGYSWVNGTYSYSAATRTASQITDPLNARNGIVAASTFYGGLSGNATSSSYPQGFINKGAGGWGTIATIGTLVTDWGSSTGGDIQFRERSGQLYVGVDGTFYQREGTYEVIDTSTINNYAPTKTGVGASGTWNIGITGNAATTTKLQTARTINGTSFDGSSNITTATWGNARTITLAGNSSGSVSINGGSNVTLNVSNNYATTASTCTGNAASATKLATARTIYGNSFDGTSNVDGRVTAIANGITSSFGASNSLWCHMNTTAPAFWFEKSISTQGNVYPYINNNFTCGTSSNRWSNTYTQSLDVAGRATMNGGANIGYTNTNYKLSVNEAINNGWWRSVGATGWYSETYGGGIYMTDTTYVRTYNNKSIYTASNILAGGEITAYSDRRLKSNIKPLENRGTLNPVTYEKNGKESIGFIAQEVQELYPELVTTDDSTDEKYLSLNYAQLTAVLAAQINELQNRVAELEAKLNQK